MKNSTLQFKIENKIISLLFIASVFILIFSFYVLVARDAFASETSGTIVSGGNNGYAWSNQSGWVNFGCSNCSISIMDSGITGYAWNNNYGWINMKPTNGGVTVAANGALSGYAWGSSLGWINFSGVSINSSGKFTGQASGTTVGTLTFDCTNCSVTTDFKPQNFRATPQSASSGGGGGGGGKFLIPGPGGQFVPPYFDAVDTPLTLLPVQSGTLTQNLTNQKRVTLYVPSNVFSDELTFVIREEAITSTIAQAITVIGNAIFNITTRDSVGNLVSALLKPVKITFSIPEFLRGRTDLGVYFFDPVRSLARDNVASLQDLGEATSNGVDEAARVWVKVQGVVFSGDSVSFSVDHLTLFAIFAGPELSPTIEAPFQLPPQFQFEIPRTRIEPSRERIEVPAEEVPLAEITPEEKPPLFDIKVSPGPSESKKTRTFVVLAILIIAVAGAIFYILRRMSPVRNRGRGTYQK